MFEANTLVRPIKTYQHRLPRFVTIDPSEAPQIDALEAPGLGFGPRRGNLRDCGVVVSFMFWVHEVSGSNPDCPLFFCPSSCPTRPRCGPLLRPEGLPAALCQMANGLQRRDGSRAMLACLSEQRRRQRTMGRA